MKRAPILTEEIILIACKRCAEEGSFSQLQAEEIASQYSNIFDGYELAKELEEYCGWEIDMQIVEELDNVSSYVRDEMKIERKKWFEENDIQPPFTIGTELKEGVIHSIYEYDVAYYKVKAHGCTEDSRYTLIKFENAKLKDEASK